jgi:hypothetical protein
VQVNASDWLYRQSAESRAAQSDLFPDAAGNSAFLREDNLLTYRSEILDVRGGGAVTKNDCRHAFVLSSCLVTSVGLLLLGLFCARLRRRDDDDDDDDINDDDDDDYDDDGTMMTMATDPQHTTATTAIASIPVPAPAVSDSSLPSQGYAPARVVASPPLRPPPPTRAPTPTHALQHRHPLLRTGDPPVRQDGGPADHSGF